MNLAAPFRSDADYWSRRITAITASARNRTQTESFSYYAQQEADLFSRVLLQAAWRNDRQDSENVNQVSGARLATEDDTDSFRYGATFFLTRARKLAVYGVYSDQNNLTSTFTKCDAGVNYRWKRYSVDLFVKNLTDAPIILFRGGDPRSYTLTVDVAW